MFPGCRRVALVATPETNIDRADAEDPTSWAERTWFTYQVAARGGIPAPANQPSPTVATHERPYTALQLKHLDNLGLWYRHHGHPYGNTRCHDTRAPRCGA